MQLNEARFELYGRCGMVPKPDCMINENYNPYNNKHMPEVEGLLINIQVCNVVAIKNSLSQSTKIF